MGVDLVVLQEWAPSSPHIRCCAPVTHKRLRIRWIWIAPTAVYAAAVWKEDGWLGLVIGLAIASAFVTVALTRAKRRRRE